MTAKANKLTLTNCQDNLPRAFDVSISSGFRHIRQYVLRSACRSRLGRRFDTFRFLCHERSGGSVAIHPTWPPTRT
jgi:hypothetical protein